MSYIEPEDIQFARIFREYHSRFVRFAYNYVRDSALAEDITMDAMTKYWENRTALEIKNIPAYILTIVKNRCLNHLEHLSVRMNVSEKIKKHEEWKLQTSIASLRACDPNEVFSEEIERIVRETLETLPEQTQKIYRMSRHENIPHKDIAEQTGITIKGVEFHIAKTMKALRDNLKDYLYLFMF